MPRDLPLGNGNLLVAFDSNYQIRDLYWPHVGQENHANGHPFRMGVSASGVFRWLSDVDWQREIKYETETLVSAIKLTHPDLGLDIQAVDAVDFYENLLIRRFEVTNRANLERDVHLYFHHDFRINGNEAGDTAYYEPDERAIIHYKGANWFLINGAVVLAEGDPGPGWEAAAETIPGLVAGVHKWACGLKQVPNLEGTWRDAEDNCLSGNPVAHGLVDSTVGFTLKIPAFQKRSFYYWMAIGPNFESVVTLNRMAQVRGPQAFIDRTSSYWRLWLKTHTADFVDLPDEISRQYGRSLLVIRTQIDNDGAIIAANDSDISSHARDAYSYMWPRDGSLVARALTEAGFVDLPRAFFRFCDRAQTKEGYLLHKYHPDGTLASSWHPWYVDGKKSVPIQEDETALVLWALWAHFERFGDVGFIRPLYRHMIVPMAQFLADYRDAETGLPLPSYDLWEERRGIFGWTAAATWAGLGAAARFCQAFGETDLAEAYRKAAAEIKTGVDAYLWQPQEKRFARMLNRKDDGAWEVDTTIDASLAGLWLFGMVPPGDPRMASTMQAIRQRLWIKTTVGGLARYENDYYQQVSRDIENVPGNPWIVCTLWLAQYACVTARSLNDLKPAMDILHWTVTHALPSGVLAEQVHPYTGIRSSVSPLTWSHATFVDAVHDYLRARQRLSAGKRKA
jgi:GH15 family glucan-1,4-alpha-glucosidase